jgi:hypothetical protein
MPKRLLIGVGGRRHEAGGVKVLAQGQVAPSCGKFPDGAPLPMRLGPEQPVRLVP